MTEPTIRKTLYNTEYSVATCRCRGYLPPDPKPKCRRCGHPSTFHGPGPCAASSRPGGCPCPEFVSPMATEDCHACEHPKARHGVVARASEARS